MLCVDTFVQAWKEVNDPKSNQVYWWNESTGETTSVGAPKPQGNWLDPWVWSTIYHIQQAAENSTLMRHQFRVGFIASRSLGLNDTTGVLLL